jgi:hypothetical protein
MAEKKFNYLILINAEKIPRPPAAPPTKSLIYINLTPAEEEKSEKNKKWFAPPNIWRLDFYIGRLERKRKRERARRGRGEREREACENLRLYKEIR